jgi:hypothetical protein
MSDFRSFGFRELRGAGKERNDERCSLSEGVLIAIADQKSKVENRFARLAKSADAPDLGLRNHRSIKAVAGIKAFYFRDQDKGDPRWQEKTDKLFLGDRS